MMTVILNFAATVGISFAALFGTNEHLIGKNSYFAQKNNTIHARTVIVQSAPKQEQPQQKERNMLSLIKQTTFTYGER